MRETEGAEAEGVVGQQAETREGTGAEEGEATGDLRADQGDTEAIEIKEEVGEEEQTEEEEDIMRGEEAEKGDAPIPRHRQARLPLPTPQDAPGSLEEATQALEEGPTPQDHHPHPKEAVQNLLVLENEQLTLILSIFNN